MPRSLNLFTKMYKYPLYAMTFLWRIPLKVYPSSEREFQLALTFFPLVGFLEGFFIFLLAFVLLKILSGPILSLLLILTLFLLRGIFHLDGFSDTFDALAYRGNLDPEEDRKKRLEIMKDSTIGVAGVTAVTFLLLSKFFLFQEVILQREVKALILPFFLSRSLLMFILYFAKPARKDGLGYLMFKLTDQKIFLLSLFVGFILLFLYFLIFPQLWLKDLLLISGINFLVIIYFQRLFSKNFGGLTGDNLGALIEISELVSLFYLGVLWPRL